MRHAVPQPVFGGRAFNETQERLEGLTHGTTGIFEKPSSKLGVGARAGAGPSARSRPSVTARNCRHQREKKPGLTEKQRRLDHTVPQAHRQPPACARISAKTRGFRVTQQGVGVGVERADVLTHCNTSSTMPKIPVGTSQIAAAAVLWLKNSPAARHCCRRSP